MTHIQRPSWPLSSLSLSSMSIRSIRLFTTLSHSYKFTPTSRPLYLSTSAKLGSALSSQSPVMSASVKSAIDQAIAQNKVVVFSKSYCPVCPPRLLCRPAAGPCLYRQEYFIGGWARSDTRNIWDGADKA
jgi:hypothetical protein